MQHDVFANPGPRDRLNRPFLVVLQSDFTSGPRRLVCPLLRAEAFRPTKAMPLVTLNGDRFLLVAEDIFSVPQAALRGIAGSLASYRDDILLALDWLFTGL